MRLYDKIGCLHIVTTNMTLHLRLIYVSPDHVMLNIWPQAPGHECWWEESAVEWYEANWKSGVSTFSPGQDIQESGGQNGRYPSYTGRYCATKCLTRSSAQRRNPCSSIRVRCHISSTSARVDSTTR